MKLVLYMYLHLFSFSPFCTIHYILFSMFMQMVHVPKMSSRLRFALYHGARMFHLSVADNSRVSSVVMAHVTAERAAAKTLSAPLASISPFLNPWLTPLTHHLSHSSIIIIMNYVAMFVLVRSMDDPCCYVCSSSSHHAVPSCLIREMFC